MLDIKNDQGTTGEGMVTSGSTVSVGPPWNMTGVLTSDRRAIQWSNSTESRKQ